MNDTELQNILKTLSDRQLDYVAARLTSRTNKEAASKIKVSVQVLYDWENRADVEKAISLAKMDTVLLAYEKLRRLSTKAVDVLDDEMEPDKSRRIDAAKEVLDRTGVDKPKKIALTDPSGTQSYDPLNSVRAEILRRLCSDSESSEAT